MVKKGDTLIEVTLAVGIFSMIAVAITAVMSSGTAGAQTALETTLAREEIDTQADALRFIQTAYSAGMDDADNKYALLWRAITNNAVDPNANGMSDKISQYINYAPTNCKDDPYGNSDLMKYAFVINPQALGTFTAESMETVLIKNSTTPPSSNDKLTYASTYPHLIFNITNNQTSDNTNLSDNTSSYTDLYRAEGIFVIAVKDHGTTSIVKGNSLENNAEPTPAFYDFYVRTCWYGTDDNQPSTISTLMRLYDPGVIKSASKN